MEVINELLGRLVLGVGEFEFEFAFFGPQDDGLAVHAADHIEGSAGLAAQGHFQEVVFNAGFDRLAQLAGDLEEAVRRTEPADALVRALVVVIFGPELDALARGLEAVELSAGKELLPERFPEPLDFTESHRVMRTGFEVGDPVLFELGFEAGSTTPGSVLAAVIGEHLAWRFKLGHRLAVDFDDRLGRWTAEQIGTDNEPRVIVHERDDVSVATTQAEGEDVGLPHLVGSGALEEARPGNVALVRFGSRRHELGFMQALPNGLRTGLEKQNPTQPLGDAFNTETRVLLFDFEDFGTNGRVELLPPFGRWGALIAQAFLAIELVSFGPVGHRMDAKIELLGNGGLGEAFFEVELHGAEFQFERIARAARIFWRAPTPPRGGGVRVFLVDRYVFFHGCTPVGNNEVSTTLAFKLVS
jgi:hypothetical protein